MSWEDDPIASGADWQKDTVVKAATAQDRAQAFASGVNKGALSYLPGLPVKTVLDVADMLKAGYGAAGKATGFLSPSEMPQLINRETVAGSPEWFQAKIRGGLVNGGRIIDPNAPNDVASRILHSGGVAVGAAPVPGQIAKQAAAGIIGQGTAEAGLPDWATVAGMAPFAGAASTGPKLQQPILTPEQKMIRQRALDLGYELTPFQQTGKQWQGNLESAMRQAPSTSGRMQRIDAANQELTNKLVQQAQAASGGAIDQGTAGGAAFNAMREGIKQQAANTGTGYRNLLGNVPVNLSGQAPAFSDIINRQSALPLGLQGGPALAQAKTMFGDVGIPGYIRENPVVPGNVAQDIRSAYTSAAQGSENAQQAGIYRDMRRAVDAAIEQSVPQSKRGEFAALNAKYGYDKAIAGLEPKNQETFLTQLYRGSPDQFYTFLGVVDPASFSQTARGFISKLIEKATIDETGNVSARKLGAAIDTLDPGQTGRANVMKYFGGPAEQGLRDVGNIGKNILPEASGNPGTAQRLWYQSLLRGGGMASGAGLGAILGGSPGAVLGSLAGDFVVPKAIQMAYLSPKMRGLLVNGKQQQFGPQEELLRKYGGLLGYSASQ